jgi:hypothetical protein
MLHGLIYISVPTPVVESTPTGNRPIESEHLEIARQRTFGWLSRRRGLEINKLCSRIRVPELPQQEGGQSLSPVLSEPAPPSNAIAAQSLNMTC